MLVEFSVSNFKTIRELACLSMVAEKLHGNESSLKAYFTPLGYRDLQLLRSAVLYGANASGKTNVLKAFVRFRNMILNSTDTKFGELLEYEPFALSKETINKPTKFELEFIAVDDVRYIYGFAYNKHEILEEYLYSFANNNRRSEIFAREKGSPIKFGSSFKGHKKSLEDQLQNNHLLLTKAANSNFEQLHPIYRYFKANVPVLFSKFEDPTFTKRKSMQVPQFLEKINEFLRKADTGIDSVKIAKKPLADGFAHESPMDQPFTPLEVMDSYLVNVIHTYDEDDATKSVAWSLDNESLGTRRLFALAGPAIDALSNGFVLFIDELDNHFHPLLSEMLVELFNDPTTNPLNAQLIFTTHDVSLLNKENFRRDQIWFIEKNQNGASRLFPLSAFDKKHVRWDTPFDKWYMSGKFGATPLIGEFDIRPL